MGSPAFARRRRWHEVSIANAAAPSGCYLHSTPTERRRVAAHHFWQYVDGRSVSWDADLLLSWGCLPGCALQSHCVCGPVEPTGNQHIGQGGTGALQAGDEGICIAGYEQPVRRAMHPTVAEPTANDPSRLMELKQAAIAIRNVMSIHTTSDPLASIHTTSDPQGGLVSRLLMAVQLHAHGDERDLRT